MQPARESIRNGEPAAREHHADGREATDSGDVSLPVYTTPACRTSPVRMQNESIACFALNFVSRLVGNHSTCTVVLPSE